MREKALLIIGWLVGLSLLVGGGYYFFINKTPNEIVSPWVDRKDSPKPLEKYYFENLKKQKFIGSEIKLEKVIKDEEKYASWLFSFKSEGKRVTGMANLPKKSSQLPVIIMIRGYADEEIYFTGLGTRKAAGIFAENGFLTLAPDFLGFGGSDQASPDVLEARFERPITAINLLNSLETLPQANLRKVFLWGHSNGGQIALSVLEITGANIPTVLWSPVTKGFPEGILQYMPKNNEELDENGKMVKRRIEEFTRDYDPRKVSIDYYFSDINAPLQLHQGGSDDLVKMDWTNEFVDKLKNLGKDIVYFKYPKSDHNLKEDWDEVVKRDLEFFRKY